jgi:hypothetical protein
VGGAVALVPEVEHQHVLAGAAQHQRAAQPGGATTDDEAIK